MLDTLEQYGGFERVMSRRLRESRGSCMSGSANFVQVGHGRAPRSHDENKDLPTEKVT